MVLKSGEKLFVAHRRLFDADHARFFIGIVDIYEHGIARVTGFSWSRDHVQGSLLKKKDVRTRLIGVGSVGEMVYVLPDSVDLDSLVLQNEAGRAVVLTDGKAFRVDITDRNQGTRLGGAR